MHYFMVAYKKGVPSRSGRFNNRRPANRSNWPCILYAHGVLWTFCLQSPILIAYLYIQLKKKNKVLNNFIIQRNIFLLKTLNSILNKNRFNH